MLLTVLGFVLLYFGINQNESILLLASLVFIFIGFGGLYYGFNNMRGSMLLRNNNLFIILAGFIAVAVVLSIFIGY